MKNKPTKSITTVLLMLALILSNCLAVSAKETASVDVNMGGGQVVTLAGDYWTEEARKTLDAVNELRAEKGLEPLVWGSELDELGKLRAAEIQEYYSHARPSGEARTIIKDGKVIVTGENIAAGYESAAEVMEGWTNSKGHYENMTYDKYQSYYCACYVTYDEEYGWPWYTWVQLFTFDKLTPDEPEQTDPSLNEELSNPTRVVDGGNDTEKEEPSEIIDLRDNTGVSEGAADNGAGKKEDTKKTEEPVLVVKEEPVTVIRDDAIVVKEEPVTVIRDDTIVVKEEPVTVISDDTITVR